MSHAGFLIELEQDKRPHWEPQAKSLAACFAFAANNDKPAEIDPRTWCRAEHQARNDCAGHGSTCVTEAAFVNGTGQLIQFSPHYSYREAQREDGITGDNGATISGCLEAAKKGNCPLELCPYPSSYSSAITPDMRKAAAEYKIGSFGMPHTYDEIVACNVSGMGVHWGLGWDFSGPSQFVLDNVRGNGPGHATALLGYSTRKDSSGRPYLWLANSGYPVPGWYEVSPDAVNKALAHRYTVAIAMSRLTHPEPEPIRYDPLGGGT
jgi:hypothetical protein